MSSVSLPLLLCSIDLLHFRNLPPDWMIHQNPQKSGLDFPTLQIKVITVDITESQLDPDPILKMECILKVKVKVDSTQMRIVFSL